MNIIVISEKDLHCCTEIHADCNCGYGDCSPNNCGDGDCDGGGGDCECE